MKPMLVVHTNDVNLISVFKVNSLIKNHHNYRVNCTFFHYIVLHLDRYVHIYVYSIVLMTIQADGLIVQQNVHHQFV